MAVFIHQSTIQAPSDVVFNWHHDSDAFAKLTPPWEPVSLSGPAGDIRQDSSRTTISIKLLGFIPIPWVAQHNGYIAGQQFCDTQISGPFACWHHTHSVTPLTPTTCQYTDYIVYALPLSPLSDWVAGWFVRQKLRKLFTYRHNVVRQACE